MVFHYTNKMGKENCGSPLVLKVLGELLFIQYTGLRFFYSKTLVCNALAEDICFQIGSSLLLHTWNFKHILTANS